MRKPIISTISLLLLATIISCANEEAPVAQTAVAQSITPVVDTSAEDFETFKNYSVINFAFDSNVIDSNNTQKVKAQADYLNKYPTEEVIVSGYTDSRGTQEYNLALGNRRAESTQDLLIMNGVAKKRINTKSYGKLNPVSPGTTAQDYAANRRTETVVVGK